MKTLWRNISYLGVTKVLYYKITPFSEQLSSPFYIFYIKESTQKKGNAYTLRC